MTEGLALVMSYHSDSFCRCRSTRTGILARQGSGQNCKDARRIGRSEEGHKQAMMGRIGTSGKTIMRKGKMGGRNIGGMGELLRPL